jgi:hypothetical protein
MLYTGTTKPSIELADTQSVNLGVKFHTSVAGQVTGAQVYRGASVSITSGTPLLSFLLFFPSLPFPCLPFLSQLSSLLSLLSPSFSNLTRYQPLCGTAQEKNSRSSPSAPHPAPLQDGFRPVLPLPLRYKLPLRTPFPIMHLVRNAQKI